MFLSLSVRDQEACKSKDLYKIQVVSLYKVIWYTDILMAIPQESKYLETFNVFNVM
jgi:hypothetical protein